MATAKKGATRARRSAKGGRRAQVAAARILSSIHRIRGQRVMLDASIAELYQVETRVLVQAVTRNLARFPDDFMFQLTPAEYASLRSQSVISNARGGRRSRPYAFTEQGVAMLSSVLRSPRAVDVNVEIMRAFVRVREMLAGRTDLVRRLDALEQRYDQQFQSVFDAIRALVTEQVKPRRRIGFHRPSEEPPV
jgi:hypothetical protein